MFGLALNTRMGLTSQVLKKTAQPVRRADVAYSRVPSACAMGEDYVMAPPAKTRPELVRVLETVDANISAALEVLQKDVRQTRHCDDKELRFVMAHLMSDRRALWRALYGLQVPDGPQFFVH